MWKLPGWLSRNKSPRDTVTILRDISDDKWLEVLIESINRPKFRGITLPRFPADDLQRQFVGSAGAHALREGWTFYKVVKSYADRMGRPVQRSSRVLDLGCGWGRMVRCFLKDVAPENIWGVDVDSDVIDFCRRSFAHGRFDTVNARPPSGLPPASFDIVYAYSVFSHLNEETHLAWVEELTRLLRPGGLLLVTTQKRAFLDFCASLRGQSTLQSGWHRALARCFPDRDKALRAYDGGEFLHEATGGGAYRPPSFYGETLIPPAYVRRVWSRYLTFVEFRDEPTFLPQALIVMSKPTAS